MGLSITEILLNPFSGDPTSLPQGCIWFREDLDTFKGATSSGVTSDFITTNSTINSFDFNNNLNPKPSYQEGRLFYDYNEHTMSVYNDEADVTHQLGQEGYVRVYNNSGSLISNGSVVYISGVEIVEDRPTIGLAIANDPSKDDVIGVVTHSIENGTFGYVTTWGLVSDINTSSFTPGDTLYLSETVAGGIQNTLPSSASTVVEIGTVVKSNTSTGRILVHGSAQGPAGPQGPQGPGAVETLCSAQVRRTTAYSDIPLTWTDFSFDTIDINTDPTCISQNVDDIHIEISKTGTYLVFYQIIADDELEAQLILNDSSQIAGSYSKFGDDADTINANFPMSISVITNFNAGDDFKLQIQSTTTAENVLAGATMGVVKLEGVKGDKGDTGSGSNIIVQKDDVTVGTVTDTLNFEGTGVSTVVDEGSNKTTVTINGGGGGDPTVQEVSSTTTITNTSATPSVATSMTITPTAGTYMVWFSSTLYNSDKVSSTFIALYGGGTKLQHTEREMLNDISGGNNNPPRMPISTNGLVTVNGSQAIEVRWWENGSGTASMYERTMNIMKVA